MVRVRVKVRIWMRLIDSAGLVGWCYAHVLLTLLTYLVLLTVVIERYPRSPLPNTVLPLALISIITDFSPTRTCL